jgi:cytidine deaminase
MDTRELLNKAKETMNNAYAPYSHFKVGAAILTEEGLVYTGCNVENASYGATICAERTAAVKAVSEGYIKFSKVAIVSSEGTYTYPCGVCRQFLSEFMTKDSVIIVEDEKEGIKEVPFKELLPLSFSLNV